MSNTKWTKGKWVIEPVKDFYHVLSADKSLPYSVADTIGGLSEEMQKANAHLIAAAPELYEKLEMLHSYLLEDDPYYAESQEFNEVENLMAAARGES